MSAKKVRFDTLRSIGFAGMSAAYAAIGTALAVNPRILCINNDTDASIILSVDSGNASGNLFIPAGAFKLFDFTANLIPGKDDSFVMQIGETLYVKQAGAGAATEGAVYVEVVYATT